MTYVKSGETTHWEVWYDNAKTGGATLATSVLAVIEQDHTWLAGYWSGVTWQGSTTSGSKPKLNISAGTDGSATWDSVTWDVTSNATDLIGVREGFIAEVTEEWEVMQDKGMATYPTEGSNGESLSLFFMNRLYTDRLNLPTPKSQFAMCQNWLNGAREDGVNYSYGGDYTAHVGEVVSGIVFLNYLHTQLGYTINQIIAAGAPTFAQVYRNLTGRTDNPFPLFMQVLETVYPTGTHVDLSGLYDINNPFPIIPGNLKYFHNGAWLSMTDLAAVTPTTPTAPTAVFSYRISGMTVTLDATASKPGSTPITAYEWTYGDATTATGITATRTYTTTGSKSVSLTVRDSGGLSATNTQSYTISSPAPVADFTSSVTGLAVDFSSAISQLGSGTTTYAWTFGDGGTATTANPQHTYTAGGTFTVTLTVTDSLGGSSTKTHTVTVVAASAGYEYLGTSTAVKTATQLSPSGAAVAQQIVHHNDTGEYWITQVTASTDPTYTENTRVSRMSSSGANLGQMVLFGAGHGLSLNVDYQGTQPFVWVQWDMPASGSTRQYDTVRFPWSNTGSTVQSRDGIANLDVMIPGNGGPRGLHIDWEAQRAVITSFGSASLYNLSDIIDRGTLYAIKTIQTPYTSADTFQGFCTYNDSLFYLFGGQKNDGDADTTDPLQIWEWSWITGQKIKTLSLANVGKSGTAAWTGTRTEVEGLCVYDPGVAGTNPQMQFVDVTGVSGAHTWDVWQVDVKTQYEAAGLGGFIFRSTKPTEANVGAGILRPVTNTITPSGGVYTVTTTGAAIKDTLIKGSVVVKASGVVFENCIIEGPQSYPGDATTAPNVTMHLVDTNDPACATTPPVFRYSTIYQKFNCPIMNAFTNRYFTAENCNIYNVVGVANVTGTSTVSDVKVLFRGNYVHDLIFAAGAVTGNTPRANLNTYAGNYVNGTYRALAFTHDYGFRVDGTTTTNVNVYGNNIVGLWSRDKAISMMPLPYDNNGDVTVREIAAVTLAGGVNLIIEDNWFDGGEACVYNTNAAVTGVIRRNKFGRRMDKPLGLTGTATTDDPKYWALVVQTGLLTYEADTANKNIWEDTKNTVNPMRVAAAPATDYLTFTCNSPISGANPRYHLTNTPWSAMLNWWGVYSTADDAAVFTSDMKVSPSQFPVGTTFDWNLTPETGYSSVSGYLSVTYGNYERDAASIPGGSKQVNNITKLEVDQAWTWTGDTRSSILCELFLDSAAVGANVQAPHIAEVGFFPKPSQGSINYFNSSVVIGSGGFTDRYGVTWAVRQDYGAQGKYYMIHRPDHSEFEGILPFTDALAFLKANGEITGSEWVNGVAFGAEPRVGISSYTVDRLNVTYL